jgi:soluble lytic murein transglycosylase-like protein
VKFAVDCAIAGFVAFLAGRDAHAQPFWSHRSASRAASVAQAPDDERPRWTVWMRTGPGKAAALRGTTDIVPARDVSPARFTRYDRVILDVQLRYGIPSALIRAVIQTESDFDPRVVSSAGAKGLMQLMPETARRMGVSNPFDPRDNITGGTRYLQLLTRRFCRAAAKRIMLCSPGEYVRVVAAYHAGPGAVLKYGGLPPYETTRSYVAVVLRRYAAWSDRRSAPAARGVPNRPALTVDL